MIDCYPDLYFEIWGTSHLWEGRRHLNQMGWQRKMMYIYTVGFLLSVRHQMHLAIYGEHTTQPRAREMQTDLSRFEWDGCGWANTRNRNLSFQINVTLTRGSVSIRTPKEMWKVRGLCMTVGALAQVMSPHSLRVPAPLLRQALVCSKGHIEDKSESGAGEKLGSVRNL